MRVHRFFNTNGHLFPYDVRFDPDDAAYCEILNGGRARFRLMTEHGFTQAVIAAIDGTGTSMARIASDRRFDTWEAEVAPPGDRFEYTFALRTRAGKAVYLVPSGITNASERLDFWTLHLGTPTLGVPHWARGAMIYQIFPERFASGDPSGTPPDAAAWGSPPQARQFQGGDLRGITQQADYLAELGVDAVFLNPIFKSPSNHRYDTIDYYQVDPILGGNAALRELVEELHRRGMRLILDASFNHCHPDCFAFTDVVERGPESEYWTWFDIREHPISVRYRPEVIRRTFPEPDRFLEYMRTTVLETGIPFIEAADEGPPVEPSYDSWYDVPTMPRIMLSDPGARRYFLDVAAYWLREYDIDGWRMDVARYIDPDFWNDFRAAAREAKPDAYLLSEIMGDSMPWLQGDRFDATMNYTFRDLCVDFCAETTCDAREFVDGLIRMYGRYAPAVNDANHNLLSSHDTQRFLTVAGGRPERLALATLLQMTLPGAPGVYYGDEVGMTGGHDPGSRGAFPWHDPASWNRDLQETVRSLGRLRRQHSALRRGVFEVVWQSNEAFAFTRTLGEERLLVVVNREDDAIRIEAPVLAGNPQVVWGSARVSATDGTREVHGIERWSGAVIAS